MWLYLLSLRKVHNFSNRTNEEILCSCLKSKIHCAHKLYARSPSVPSWMRATNQCVNQNIWRNVQLSYGWVAFSFVFLTYSASYADARFLYFSTVLLKLNDFSFDLYYYCVAIELVRIVDFTGHEQLSHSANAEKYSRISFHLFSFFLRRSHSRRLFYYHDNRRTERKNTRKHKKFLSNRRIKIVVPSSNGSSSSMKRVGA